MEYWLLKSEPSVYSFDDLKRDKRTVWDGIRNYQARNNLRSMKTGDLCFFYHSGEEKAVVGLAKVTKEAYPDPKEKGEDWSVVEIEYIKPLKPVALAQVKKTPALKSMQLVTHARLSVQTVDQRHYDLILAMG